MRSPREGPEGRGVGGRMRRSEGTKKDQEEGEGEEEEEEQRRRVRLLASLGSPR